MGSWVGPPGDEWDQLFGKEPGPWGIVAVATFWIAVVIACWLLGGLF